MKWLPTNASTGCGQSWRHVAAKSGWVIPQGAKGMREKMGETLGEVQHVRAARVHLLQEFSRASVRVLNKLINGSSNSLFPFNYELCIHQNILNKLWSLCEKLPSDERCVVWFRFAFNLSKKKERRKESWKDLTLQQLSLKRTNAWKPFDITLSKMHVLNPNKTVHYLFSLLLFKSSI